MQLMQQQFLPSTNGQHVHGVLLLQLFTNIALENIDPDAHEL